MSLRKKFNQLFQGKDAASIVGITSAAIGAAYLVNLYIKQNRSNTTSINENETKQDEKEQDNKLNLNSKEKIEPKVVVITGANRGIGLEFVKQYMLKDYTKLIVACCRKWQSSSENDIKKRNELESMDSKFSSKLKIIEGIDNEDDASIAKLRREIETLISNFNDNSIDIKLSGIDLLILNSGIIGNKGAKTRAFFETDRSEFQRTFNINICGTLSCAKELYSLVNESKCKELVCITSRMGSIGQVIGNLDRYSNNPKTQVHAPRAVAYRISKCGLNMAFQCIVGQTLQDGKGCHCLLVHPGWVQTDMGGPKGKLTTSKSVTNMIDVIAVARYTMKNGSFVSADNKTYIEW